LQFWRYLFTLQTPPRMFSVTLKTPRLRVCIEKYFGAKQEGLQSTLISKLQLMMWDGSGVIHTHCEYMVNLRNQLVDAGMTLANQIFYQYLTESLPSSLDLFITLYEDTSHDVDFLCDKISKYKMHQKQQAVKSGKADTTSDGSIALYGQQSSDKEK
jgi:hypothetical protein